MAYLIGEIGQNHNGSVDIAKLLIDIAARPVKDSLFGTDYKGWNAVKMTKRDLSQELTKSAMSQPYNSPHSFGKTYGEHRSFLELSNEEHYQCYLHAKAQGLDFIETLCSIGCLSILELFSPDRLKVASRDLTNLPLLKELAHSRIPMILSTGMAGPKELDDALDTIYKFHDEVSILHCVSEYPTKPENVNLRTIDFLKKRYSRNIIGYSDHTIGISASTAAVAMGAEIIEKHITIDRNLKGTDQAGSLGIDGMMRLCRDIRILESSFGEESMFISDAVSNAKIKLERSIASKQELRKGHIIVEDDLHMLSPGSGLKWSERDKIIGKEVSDRIAKDELILTSSVK